MPNVGVIDTTRNKPEPSDFEQFFSKLGKDYREKQDKVELNDLISSYQQNRQDANAWEDLQLGLEKSNISPTKRIETQQRLNEMKKVIVDRDKALNAQAKASVENAKQQAQEEARLRQREALAKAGATEQQMDLYDAASVGGQTKVMADILEDIERKKTP